MKNSNITAIVMITTCALAACGDDGSGREPGFGSFGTGSANGETSGDGDPSGDGDGSPAGDGDGAPAGDGDGAPGDGDGAPAGDGDGAPAGDGDGPPGGDGDGEAELVPCDVPEVALEPVMPHVVLVLDKSGSMIQSTWDHDANPQTPKVTRWKSLHAVVMSIVDQFEDQFEFGAQLFPAANATNEYDISACYYETPPEVPIAAHNATQILLGIPVGTSQNIRGGTPTAAGMISAIDHLLTMDDGDPAAIILVTDGAANCRFDAANQFERFETYDPNLLGIVADAYADLDIPTYVVGIDISDAVTPVTGEQGYPPDGQPDGISPFAQLNQLAVAGGKPLGGFADFYQTQNQIELEAAIQAIVDDAASCTVTLDPPPPFPNLVEVVVDGAYVPRVDDCASEDGWVFSQPNGPYSSVELCGSWCDDVAGAQELMAEYYCDPG